jgi:hypothetical protein
VSGQSLAGDANRPATVNRVAKGNGGRILALKLLLELMLKQGRPLAFDIKKVRFRRESVEVVSSPKERTQT